MTQDQIIQVLHKVIAENQNFTTWTVSTPHLVSLVNYAIEAEREACIHVCREIYSAWMCETDEDVDAPDPNDCIRAIRARGVATSRGEAL